MTAEIVDVAFAYPVVAVLPRRRSSERVMVLGRVPAMIETLASAAAPLVCEIPSQGHRPGGPPVVVRSFEGRFWRTIDLHGGQARSGLSDLRDHAAGRTKNRPYPDPLVFEAPEDEHVDLYRLAKEGRTIESLQPRQVFRSSFAESAALAQTYITGLRLVGGEIYAPCPEPVLEVRTDWHRCGICATFPGETPPIGEEVQATFRIDRMTDALQMARTIMDEYLDKDEDVLLEPVPDIVIHDASALMRDDVVESARPVLDTLQKTCLPALMRLPRAGILAFADLREAADELQRTGARTAAESLVRSYRAMVGIAEKINTEHEDDHTLHDIRRLVSESATHERRWRLEPDLAPTPDPVDDDAIGQICGVAP